MNDDDLIDAVTALLASEPEPDRGTPVFRHFVAPGTIDMRPRSVIDAERIERGLQPLGTRTRKRAHGDPAEAW